ncbi:hypothetical protein GCM10007920_43410 [Ciceribacter naphthalenivorans]|uniref:Uncharacterized protein n=3 Tax=Pseudomonadota TaxID=1224 RepID=A0A512HI45_9HYPH|nr:hypothetical protein RNA01_20510 [Ciceribacter naphthalenivorans]GLR24547.1 hypothetical protein GCM10007920_43410 [Ciceribacter naphthalenivorans]GLT07403.1 hypothetical protein GCM10007926_43410 [Sphingomonas psychrolutea]
MGFPEREREDRESSVSAQFSVSEGWVGDLSNGVIKLGERATQLHGLNNPECGLLSMMRCYDPNDRSHILELFEQAATASSHFCYSTTISLSNGHRQPVFCIGESDGLEQSCAGRMLGIFVFPRFRLVAPATVRAYS